MNSEAETPDTEENTAQKAPLSVWKKWSFGIALLLSGIGIIMSGIAAFTDSPEPEVIASSNTDTPGLRIQSMPPGSFIPDNFNSSAPNNFNTQDYPLPNQEQNWPTPEQTGVGVGDWSTLFMKLGFSFVAGFSIAYALSSFLKLGLFMMGSVFLLLFGLQYVGIIDVNWQQMGNHYDAFIAWLQPHIGSFRGFITSNLPSSVLAGAGLVAGFRV